MRRRRFDFFLALLEQLPRPVRVLDVGGRPAFWQAMGFHPSADVTITVLNIESVPEVEGFGVMKADVRSMKAIRDGEYDVVFSNSMIEHVGSWHDQQQAAAEIRRIAVRYFVQTPNRYFPIEPHFLFPGFQFLPVAARAALLARTRLGWHPRAPDYASARRTVEQVRLLTRSELVRLFPDAHFYVERIGPFTKSYTCYGGWETVDDQPDGFG